MFTSERGLNDVNKPGRGVGLTSQPMDNVNMNIASTTAVGDRAGDISLAGGSAGDMPLAAVQRLMDQAAAEMNADAEKAIRGLKKDKDLWNRVERLNLDSHQHGTGMDADDVAGS